VEQGVASQAVQQLVTSSCEDVSQIKEEQKFVLFVESMKYPAGHRVMELHVLAVSSHPSEGFPFVLSLLASHVMVVHPLAVAEVHAMHVAKDIEKKHAPQV
jgi:hypothetical protein